MLVTTGDGTMVASRLMLTCPRPDKPSLTLEAIAKYSPERNRHRGQPHSEGCVQCLIRFMLAGGPCEH